MLGLVYIEYAKGRPVLDNYCGFKCKSNQSLIIREDCQSIMWISGGSSLCQR